MGLKGQRVKGLEFRGSTAPRRPLTLGSKLIWAYQTAGEGRVHGGASTEEAGSREKFNIGGGRLFNVQGKPLLTFDKPPRDPQTSTKAYGGCC